MGFTVREEGGHGECNKRTEKEGPDTWTEEKQNEGSCFRRTDETGVGIKRLVKIKRSANLRRFKSVAPSENSGEDWNALS